MKKIKWLKTFIPIFLNSYNGVNWKIEGHMPAFIFYKANNGSLVTASKGEIFPWNGNQIRYNSFILEKNSSCHCLADNFSCYSGRYLQ